MTNDFGRFSFSSAHWFENEGVAYLFFSIDEFPERIENSLFQFAYTWRNSEGGTNTVPLETIDFNNGTHQHQLVKCGAKKLCGSFSWPLSGAIESLQIKFLYDKESPLSLDQIYPNIQNHGDDGSANAFSALPYGIFNKENNRIQFRVFHNFGYPSANEVKQFGMTRKFKILDAYLDDSQEIKDLTTTIQTSGYVFPASFCTERNEKNEAVISNKDQYWLKEIFSEENNDKGACLELEFLDQQNNILINSFAYGLRNPIVGENGLVLQTPLRSTIKIPVVIASCPGEFSDGLINDDFLKYQRHILEIGGDTIDVCYDINDRDQFRTDLRSNLQNKLNETKLENAPNANDYSFIVLYHENLNQDFFQFHSIVSEELFQIADAEASFNSPKLVGSLVYGSTAQYAPTLAQKKYIIWCPQEQPDELFDVDFPLSNPNCTISDARELKILGIPFVQPMGPFPNLENYTSYVEKYGETGLAKEPKLVIRSVPSGPNTIIEKSRQVTYFDNVRVTINEDEAVKVCYEKEGADQLSYLRFRPFNIPDLNEGLEIQEVESIWNSESSEGHYRIGLKWDFPFWGGISYSSQAAVDVVSVIPVFNRFDSNEDLGDPIWSFSQWNVGEYLHQCRKYCSHPFFDVNGSYRNNGIWKINSNNQCLPGTHPVWKQEGV